MNCHPGTNLEIKVRSFFAFQMANWIHAQALQPILRPLAQTRRNGVLLDIPPRRIEMPPVTHGTVEILLHPERPTTLEYPIGLLGSIRFPRVQNR